MNALFVEGDSWLHRLSPRAKLLALMAISILLFLSRSPWVLSGAVAAGATVYLQLGMPFGKAIGRLRSVLLTIAIVALLSFAVNSAEDALVALLRLTALTLFAAAVTATTGVGDFIDEITLAARPLETLHILQAADIGLAVGLVIRFVPEILNRYAAIREAHKARGLPLRPLTLAVPLIILTLKDADNIAAAIDARGFRRQGMHGRTKNSSI